MFWFKVGPLLIPVMILIWRSLRSVAGSTFGDGGGPRDLVILGADAAKVALELAGTINLNANSEIRLAPNVLIGDGVYKVDVSGSTGANALGPALAWRLRPGLLQPINYL